MLVDSWQAHIGVDPTALAALAVLSLVLAACLRRSLKPRLAALALLTAVALTGAAAHGARLTQAAAAIPAEPFEAVVEARVCETHRAVGRLRLLLCSAHRVDNVGRPAVPERILLDLSASVFDQASPQWLQTLTQGEVLRARLRLRRQRSRANPGHPPSDRRLVRRGIGATARLVDPRLAVRAQPDGGLVALLRAWRQRTRDDIASAGPGSALVLALAMGEREGLDPPLRQALVRLGVVHLAVVSGLHLALVAGAAYWLGIWLLLRTPLARSRDPRVAALAFALALAVAYGLAAGWAVPVRRALAAMLAVALAFVLGAARNASAGLSLAAIAVLAREPAALFAPGAQLSFAASAALLSLRPDAGAEEHRWPWLRQILSASAAASAATAPVLALHGLMPSLVGTAMNLLFVPWTALVLLPACLAAAALVAVGAAPLDRPVLGVAMLCARETEVAARTLADWLEPVMPLGEVAPAASLLTALACAPLVALALRGPRLRWRVAAAVSVAAMLRWATPPVLPPSPPRVVVLDVGSGDATLVQGTRAALLVDAAWAVPGRGNLGRNVVLPALRALGVQSLTALVLTHADVDHRGGATAVLETLDVDELWLPESEGVEGGLSEAVVVAQRRGVLVRQLATGQKLVRDDLVIDVLWPGRALRGSSNHRSLVLRIRLGDDGAPRVLLPGDVDLRGEAALLESGLALRSEILLLPHHGSASSSSRAFLDAVAPEVVAISASCPSRGLPNRDVVRRARATGAALWWTGRDGAISIGASPLRVWGERSQPACRFVPMASLAGDSASASRSE